MADVVPAPPNAFGSLRRLVRARDPEELCELCGERLPEEHRHLLEPSTRKILCGCAACGILFSRRSETHYRTIPVRIRRLADLRLPDEVWDGLGLPVNIAFFQHHAATGKVVAYYPSPGGATESLLPLDSWRDLEAANPELAEIEPDVEGLLVNRMTRSGGAYIAPIDECYRLVGLIRVSWKGISGGTEVWASVDEFFRGLAARADREVVRRGP